MIRPLYLLDTNIISELAKSYPNQNVVEKVCKNINRCAISSTTLNELLFGLQLMPEGKIKRLSFQLYC